MIASWILEVPKFAEGWLDVFKVLGEEGRIPVDLLVWANAVIALSLYAQAKAGGLEYEFYLSTLERPCKTLGVTVEELEAAWLRVKGP